MDDNKRIIELEVRVMKLELIIDGFTSTLNNSQYYSPACGMCGADPLTLKSCASTICPHGLGEATDEER